MLRPVSGVQHVVSLLDEVVTSRPHLPPLVVAVACDDPGEARVFVEGYRARLSDIRGNALVPHAYAGPVAVKKAKQHALPEVGLLDELVKQLCSTIPTGAGRRWRPRRFLTCLDVVNAAGQIDTKSVQQTRADLLGWLYGRWEGRAPLLSWTRTMSVSAAWPSKIIGLVLSVLLNGPSRWWFARRLNRRGLRWFGEQVSNVNGMHGDFLDQAVWLLPSSGLEDTDIDSLRQRILFDALLRDVAMFMRRKRFLPSRRRRRWTPVLLFDGTDSLPARLVEVFAQLTADQPTAPLLVLAALPGDEAQAKAGTLYSIDEATAALRSVVNGEANALNAPPWLGVSLPGASAGEDSLAKLWIGSHHRVIPQVPGRVSAFAPLMLTVLLVTGTGGYATYRVLTNGCADTRINGRGERIGLIESGCSFDQPTADGVPSLKDLEQAVVANNNAVDSIKDSNGNPQYYRKVVFFAPLTRPNAAERTAPPNAIWQLQGAVEAQAEYNEQAKANASLIPIKLVLANSGDHFEQDDGSWVADQIMASSRSGRGGLAAVIGISQSRPWVSQIIKNHLAGVPVIGASMYGRKMHQDNDNMFMTAPLNRAFADTIAEWAKAHGHTQAAVVYDPADEYFSSELRDRLRDAFSDNDTSRDITVIENPQEHPDDIPSDQVKRICADANTAVPVLAGRADQIIKFLNATQGLAECNGIDMVAGPGLIVQASATNLAQKYPWLHLTIAGLAGNPADSERTTGRDAFKVAAEAAKRAHESAQENWDTHLALSTLQNPNTTNALRDKGIYLNDDNAEGRITMIRLG